MKEKSSDHVHLAYVLPSCLTKLLQVHANQGPDSFCPENSQQSHGILGPNGSDDL